MIRNTAFHWQVPVPQILLDEARFDRWSEGTQQPEKDCIFKVDDDGFFLCCTPPDKWSKRGKPTGNERSFTIFAGRNLVDIRYVQLSADDPELCQQWTAGLRQIIRNVKAKFISPMTMLRKRWKHFVLAVDKRGRIPVHQFTALFGSGTSEDCIRRRLKKLQLLDKSDDTVDPAELPFDKFFDLYLLMCPRPDLKRLFDQLNDPDHGNFLELFLRFLNKEQRDPRTPREEIPYYTETRLRQLIQVYEPDIQHKKRNLLSFNGFCRYMMSDENAPIFLDRLDLHQNMGHPLNHYFINSSHNTYLIGKQINGISSVEMYRQVLFTGCRCIELDIWDGDGDALEPVITHAHEVLETLCTKISFKDALVAIRDTAFQTSNMPVILSFENHCSPVQQEKMAKYCDEILGDLLLKAPLEEHPLQPSKPLPSPSTLARRILIKNKRLPSEKEKRELDSMRRNQKTKPQPRDNRTKARSLVPRDEEPTTKVSLRPFYSDANVSVRSGLRDAISTALSLSDHSPKDSSRGYHHLVSAGSPVTNSGYQRPDSILEETSSHAENVQPGLTAPVTQEASGTDRREYSTLNTTDSSSVHRTTSLDLEAFLIADTSSMSSMVESGGSAEEAAALAAFKPTKSTSVIHASLSVLVNYTQAIAFPGFAAAEEKKLCYHMSSFDAQAAIALLRSSAYDMLEYNKRQLSRIYPAFPRGIFSKNFLPHIFWSTGCQMIALNFQTQDIPMQINSALFEFNGNCGFLLKPELMRRSDRSFDPFSQAAVDGLVAACCTIEIISGHFLCERRTGTYVEVEMYGLPTDTIRNEYRTPTVLDNGLDPVYDAPKFVFRKIVFPELATIRFCVYDEYDRVLGQRVLPFQHLQAGYRHIPLRSEANCPLPLATLICRISMDTYIVPVGTSLVDSLLDPWKKPHAGLTGTGNRLPVRRAFGEAVCTNSPERSEPVDGEHQCGSTSVMVVKKQKSFISLQQKQEAEKATLLASHVSQCDLLRASHEAAKDEFILKQSRTRNSTMDYTSQTLLWAKSMEWSEAIYLQLRQAQKLAATQCAEQCSLLTDLLKRVQQEQLRFTDSKHKREFERLEGRQVEISMTSQKIIKKDKTISKEEKQRQLSEMGTLNARKFSEERESLKLQQRKEMVRMESTHGEQMQAVNAEREKLILDYKAAFLEAWNPPREETRC